MSTVTVLTQTGTTLSSGRLVGLNAQRTALSGTALFEGLLFYATDTRIEWLYTNSAWRAWNSDWTAYAGTWTGVTMSATGGFFRYVAGRILYEQAAIASASSTGNIAVTIPYAARQVVLRTNGTVSNSGWWATGRGNLFNGTDLDLMVGFASSTTIKFGLTNFSSARSIDQLGSGNAGVANSSEIRFIVEYDPA